MAKRKFNYLYTTINLFLSVCIQRAFDDLGWDKLKIPDGFYDLMEKLVLKRASLTRGPGRSPSKASTTWRAHLRNNLHNTRIALANFVGAKCKSQYDWYVARYNEKARFFEENFVSLR